MHISELDPLHATGEEAVLLYGGPGTGKTTFSATFPEPIHILEFDKSGITSLRGWSRDISFEDWYDPDPESNQFYFKWLDKLEELQKISKEKFPFRTVVLDGGTMFQKILMNHAFTLSTAGDKKLSKVLGIAPQQAHFSAQMAYFDQEIRRFLSLPCFKVVICHEAEGVDMKFRPLVTGKDKEKIFGLFSEIYHMETMGTGDDRQFVVRLRPNDECFAKSRLDNRHRVGTLFNWTGDDGLPLPNAFEKMLQKMSS